jgi:peptidyl-prolyl cis-trans isomerase C
VPSEVARVDDQGSVGEGADDDGTVQLASYMEPSEPVPVTGPPGLVAARVNGTPVLFADVLSGYVPKLTSVRGRMSEQEFRRLQLQLVHRDLPHVVDQLILVDAVMSKLDAEHKANVEAQLDKFFKQNVEQLMQQHQVSSEAELEVLLQTQGSSLVAERQAFGQREIAAQYVGEKLKNEKEITRQDLLAEYRAHLDEFTQPAQVKWQQLWIAYDKHGDRDAARRVLDAALAELSSGTSFDDVVRKYSDEPTAARGGHWDWTRPDSVADKELQQALSTLSVGQTSGVLAGPKAFVVVKITGRRDTRTTPFAELQDSLRDRIRERRRKEQIQAVLAEARAAAVVETMFDGVPAAPSPATPAAGR